MEFLPILFFQTLTSRGCSYIYILLRLPSGPGRAPQIWSSPCNRETEQISYKISLYTHCIHTYIHTAQKELLRDHHPFESSMTSKFVIESNLDQPSSRSSSASFCIIPVTIRIDHFLSQQRSMIHHWNSCWLPFQGVLHEFLDYLPPLNDSFKSCCNDPTLSHVRTCLSLVRPALRRTTVAENRTGYAPHDLRQHAHEFCWKLWRLRFIT